jgi:type VI secretion system secreted protein Hcp
MPFNAYMYFPSGEKSIAGSARDSVFKDKKAFKINSVKGLGGETNVNLGAATGGGGTGDLKFKEIEVEKQIDNASLPLFSAMCDGTHFKEGCIELVMSGGAGGKAGDWFLKFQFKTILPTSVEWSGEDDSEFCIETIVFEYLAIQIDYKEQKDDGTLAAPSGPAAQAMWSRKTNAAEFVG